MYGNLLGVLRKEAKALFLESFISSHAQNSMQQYGYNFSTKPTTHNAIYQKGVLTTQKYLN
jgi:hypothetical protein